MRGTARWQREQDDRILEYLRDSGWVTARIIASDPGIRLSWIDVERRLRLLADAGLVAPRDHTFEWWHITTDGLLYLRGARDQEHHPHPRMVARATSTRPPV